MNGHSGTTSTDASPASQSAAPTDDAVNDDTPDSLVQYGASSAQTTVIPLLGRKNALCAMPVPGWTGMTARAIRWPNRPHHPNNVVYGVPRHAERVTPHMTTQTRGTIEYRTSAGDGHLP